jgi:ADP-ribose pyrophosphatase YjhB (NUDIX family)
MFRLGAFALIFNEHREVLLCHRRDMDVWNLPGGGRARRVPWQAAVRETHEEVGLVVEIERLAGFTQSASNPRSSFRSSAGW